jgi:rare lipoprotein A (peptidoglycan hydrolase)
MKSIYLILTLLFLVSFGPKLETHLCTATWYDTTPHPKVHREYSTAAFNLYSKGTRLLVINTMNGKTDTVVITDRMGNNKPNRIDLSKKAFGNLANHKQGKINVIVKKI